LSPIFSSSIKVDCPDGPRYILRHPEKAFAITFPDWDSRFNFLIKFFSGAEARIEPKVFKKTKSMVKELTENYAALQAHYQAAYLGWWGNPCSKEAEKAYNDAKALICKKEFTFKELEINIRKIEAKTKIELKATRKPKTVAMREREPEKKEPLRPPRYMYRKVHREKIFVPETDFDQIEKLITELKI
jgi:hypothetical protein